MTEVEFETQLRRMIREGRPSPHDDQEGMVVDIDGALEALDLFDSIDISRTGQKDRMLWVRARAKGHSPEEVLRGIQTAFDSEIRYAGESIRWGMVEGDSARFRFCTAGDRLLVTGEIIATCPQ